MAIGKGFDLAKLAGDGKIAFDEKFFVEFDPSHRAHQVRLQGGDASSDSYCFS